MVLFSHQLATISRSGTVHLAKPGVQAHSDGTMQQVVSAQLVKPGAMRPIHVSTLVLAVHKVNSTIVLAALAYLPEAVLGMHRKIILFAPAPLDLPGMVEPANR